MASLGAGIPALLASTISMTNAWKDILAPTHKNGLVPPSKKFPTKIPHIGKWLRNRYMEKWSRTPMSYTTDNSELGIFLQSMIFLEFEQS